MVENKISVVIPYYQEERGILSKAVRSVLAQRGYSNYEIIIIDDGSPVNADKELNYLMLSNRQRIKIIKQDNSGPAAARNKGLNNVTPDTMYVAFLDSDDEWTNNHLENAICALEKGFDFYFSDWKYTKSQLTSFESITEKGALFGPSESSLLDEATPFYEWKGNFLNDIDHIIHIATSSVVYRYRDYPQARFLERAVPSEDRVFWWKILNQTNKVVFSKALEVFKGGGVNIWEKSNFDDDNFLAFISQNMWTWKHISRNYRLNTHQSRGIRNRIFKWRYEFIAVLCRQLLRKKLETKDLFSHLKFDPETFLFFPVIFPKVLFKYLVAKTGKS
jgi:succinoglycan biosynthesis protein ExoW